MTPMEELREQAAKVAEDIAKGCAGAFSVASADQKWRTAAWSGAAAHIAAAIRNIPLPAPVSPLEAGKVACLLCELINENELLLKAAQTILDRGYVSEHIEEERADYLELKTAVEVASSRHASGNLMGVLPGSTPTAATPDDGLTKAQHMLRMVAAHASGGHLENCAGMSLNDICVAISQHHNRVWEGGIEKGKKLSADDGLMGRWMPIETAPKDGTAILVFCPWTWPDGKPAHLIDVAYWGHADFWVHKTAPNFVQRAGKEPTHWIPLPAPPAALSTATGDEVQQGEG